MGVESNEGTGEQLNELPTIGDVVREWRAYRQISLTDFCEQTKLSKGYVSELEHNKISNPKKKRLELTFPYRDFSKYGCSFPADVP
jgi:transcriptional regulator with XRE-family HTH domain